MNSSLTQDIYSFSSFSSGESPIFTRLVGAPAPLPGLGETGQGLQSFSGLGMVHFKTPLCEIKLKAMRPCSSLFIFGHISHLLLHRLTFSFSLCTGAGSQCPAEQAGILFISSLPGCISSGQTRWDEIQSSWCGFLNTLTITQNVKQHGFSPGAYYYSCVPKMCLDTFSPGGLMKGEQVTS